MTEDHHTRLVLEQAAMGCWSMVGVILFFFCFDVMGDCENFILRLLRIVLVIIGALVTWFIGIAIYFPSYYAGGYEMTSAMTSASPWLQALVTCWFPGGVLASIAFAKGIGRNYYARPFMPILCISAAYFVCVPFAFLGNATISLFYWVPLAVAGFFLVVLVGTVLHGNIRLFKWGRGNDRRSAASMRERSESEPSEVPADKRKKFQGESVVRDALYHWSTHGVGPECVYSYGTDRLENLSVKVSISSNTCEIGYSGNFIYETSDDANLSELEAKHHYSETLKNITAKTKEIYQKVCRQYQGYDRLKLIIDVSGIKGSVVKV